ncbi:MAG: RtcB family protein [Candidatus Margulisbacteria bacterium]|nr:RtcB family protein [Candidatus Margulisiibacteriota bacterium]MBU1021546.1 RtcB family protein [Candidatus Margulisiibacteriota bacterium]MBU1728697.1 RtcB family protein [Candidatus Margulisiibacteriota bacterium]MBU1955148.1 RtcB family protein [Candidatus Margulisiibacteriota bacterium]
MATWQETFKKINEFKYELPKSFLEGMRVPGIIYADEQMMDHIFSENAHIQVANVAYLPGIVRASLAMPDIHYGYGFPIGGVAAFDPENGGIISPGGVGFDINCGVRILRTDLKREKVLPKIKDMVYALANNVPCGVGRVGSIKLKLSDLEKIMKKGSTWAVENGYGWQEDVIHTEGKGCLEGADPECVSSRAKERGLPQQGTLGSGNHFVEVQYVQEIYDEAAARVMGIEKDTVTIMIHSGSRGLGHQVCTDYISIMLNASRKYGIALPDRQLCCAPVNSPEGNEYFAAMAGAANYAWTNRQMMMHWAREAFAQVVGGTPEKLGMDLIYDVAHNIAKMEMHNGKLLCVHRKGATRAFPAGHPEIPEDYKEIGQPVIVPGDMGRCSFLLVGTQKAMEESFGSVCHGAGRMMSRTKASHTFKADKLVADLAGKGIVVHGASKRGLSEEAPEAYKDVRNVVNVVEGAGLAKKVAKLKPLGVIKG